VNGSLSYTMNLASYPLLDFTRSFFIEWWICRGCHLSSIRPRYYSVSSSTCSSRTFIEVLQRREGAFGGSRASYSLLRRIHDQVLHESFGSLGCNGFFQPILIPLNAAIVNIRLPFKNLGYQFRHRWFRHSDPLPQPILVPRPQTIFLLLPCSR
jgi:hypothetical protein